MKYFILPALVGAVMSQSVCAQTSSVTIYGIADIAYTYASNNKGSSYHGIDSGRWFGSRLGFKGAEDLGGGLSAIFNLEAGINVDTGAPASASSFFNRISYVGLRSSDWGSVTLGRQTSPLFDNLSKHTGGPIFGIGGGAIDGVALPGSSLGRFENTMTPPRYDNSVKYTSNRFSGMRVSAMYGFGEVAGNRSADQMQSLTLDYANGGFEGGAGYFAKKCAAATGCTATQANDRVLAVVGAYDFKVANVTVAYTQQKNAKNVKDTNGDTLTIVGSVPINAWRLSASYQMLNDKTSLNHDVKQINVGATYALSKRSSLYAFYSKQKVENGGIASLGLNNSSDSKQNLLQLGIRHMF